jgi:hypothetical protein
MSEEKQDELKSFEAALAALVPRTDRLDRERLMFLAGQQSMTGKKVRLPDTMLRSQSKRTWAWPAAFSGMSVVAATLLVMLISRPGSRNIENIANYTAPQSAPATESNETTDSSDYADRSSEYLTYFALAFLSGTDNRKIKGAESQYSNAVLLRQILAKGVDSWKPSETGHIDGKPINTRPLTNRELMNQLLDQAGTGPS